VCGLYLQTHSRHKRCWCAASRSFAVRLFVALFQAAGMTLKLHRLSDV